MGEWALNPVKTKEQRLRPSRSREYGEIGGPTGEGSGAKLQLSSPKQLLHPAEGLPLCRIHEECEGLFLEGLRVDVRYQDTQSGKAVHLLRREIHAAEPDSQDGGVQLRASGQKPPKHLAKGGRASLVQEDRRGGEGFLHHGTEDDPQPGTRGWRGGPFVLRLPAPASRYSARSSLGGFPSANNSTWARSLAGTSWHFRHRAS